MQHFRAGSHVVVGTGSLHPSQVGCRLHMLLAQERSMLVVMDQMEFKIVTDHA